MIDSLNKQYLGVLSAGRKDIAKPQAGKTIAKITPTHHEHEPKWDIPAR